MTEALSYFCKWCGKRVPSGYNYCNHMCRGQHIHNVKYGTVWHDEAEEIPLYPSPFSLPPAATLGLEPMATAKKPPSRSKSYSSDEPLLERLRKRVVGQEHVLVALSEAIEIYRSGLASPNRPVYSALYLGVTGSGKTATAEALAQCLHGDDKKVLKVDCGEYQADHEVAKLIGAPPGYLGHRETPARLSKGRLESVKSDYSSLAVVLFDEIEKAAPALQRLLLSITDKGSLSLGDSATVDFSETIILLTSNLGASEIFTDSQYAMGREEHREIIAHDALRRRAEAAARKFFSPEFINRLDDVMTFQMLSREALEEILESFLGDLRKRLRQRVIAPTLLVDEDVKTWLLDNGTDPRYGARDLRRLVEKVILRPSASLLLDYPQTSSLRALLEDGKVVMEAEEQG